MPELPDLVYIQKHLGATLPGKTISSLFIKEPIVFRILIPGQVEQAVVGREFTHVIRHGPFLDFKLSGDLAIVLHPMLAGKLKYVSSSEKVGRGRCFSIGFTDENVLHYLDDKRMGKVYVIGVDDYGQIPRFLQQGVNILSKDFTMDVFYGLIKKRRNQVRVFLMDQTVLSAIGNAYADEILFDAGIHPKTYCYQLNSSEVEHLYSSIRRVIAWGIAEVEKANQPIEKKVRDHVKVRNRKDQPCPRCGATIRRAGVLGHDTFFCPKCQPAARKQFIDWS